MYLHYVCVFCGGAEWHGQVGGGVRVCTRAFWKEVGGEGGGWYPARGGAEWHGQVCGGVDQGQQRVRRQLHPAVLHAEGGWNHVRDL
jgi:hypothetical protein